MGDAFDESWRESTTEYRSFNDKNCKQSNLQTFKDNAIKLQELQPTRMDNEWRLQSAEFSND